MNESITAIELIKETHEYSKGKVCSKCKEHKPFSEFSGKQSRCKICNNDYAKKYRARKKRAEKGKWTLPCKAAIFCDGVRHFVTEHDMKRTEHIKNCGSCTTHLRHNKKDKKIGWKTGRLTVLKRVKNNKRGQKQYLCKCDCGTEKVINSSALGRGTYSCGCLSRENRKKILEKQHNRTDIQSLIGEKINKWTVMQFVGLRKKVGNEFLCQCSCGSKPKIKTISSLKHTKSCGQCNEWFQDLTGRKYNLLTGVKKLRPNKERGGYIWLWKCDCGKEVELSGDFVVTECTKSCGCLKTVDVGSSRIDEHGYITIKVFNHPFGTVKNVDGTSWVKEHRYVMEQHIGRYLKPHENVHHKNAIKDDNRIENLELWDTSQPAGGRVKDKVEWAKWFLESQGYKISNFGKTYG
jgi:hypothetical protein